MPKGKPTEEATKAAIAVSLYEMLFATLNGNDKAAKKIIDEVFNDEETYHKVQTAFFNVKEPKNDLVGFAMEFGLVLIHNKTFMSEMEKAMPDEEELTQQYTFSFEFEQKMRQLFHLE